MARKTLGRVRVGALTKKKNVPHLLCLLGGRVERVWRKVHVVLHLAGAFWSCDLAPARKKLVRPRRACAQPAPVLSVFVTVSFSLPHLTSSTDHRPFQSSTFLFLTSHQFNLHHPPAPPTNRRTVSGTSPAIRLQCESNECFTKWYNTCCRKRSHLFSVSSSSVSLIFPFSLSLLPSRLLLAPDTRSHALTHLTSPRWYCLTV